MQVKDKDQFRLNPKDNLSPTIVLPPPPLKRGGMTFSEKVLKGGGWTFSVKRGGNSEKGKGR